MIEGNRSLSCGLSCLNVCVTTRNQGGHPNKARPSRVRHDPVLYGTAHYCTARPSLVRHSPLLYGTTLSCTARPSLVRHSPFLNGTIQSCTTRPSLVIASHVFVNIACLPGVVVHACKMQFQRGQRPTSYTLTVLDTCIVTTITGR